MAAAAPAPTMTTLERQDRDFINYFGPGTQIADALQNAPSRLKSEPALKELNTATLVDMLKMVLVTSKYEKLPLAWLASCDEDNVIMYTTPANLRTLLLGELGCYPVEANCLMRIANWVLGREAYAQILSSPAPAPAGPVEIILGAHATCVALMLTSSYAAEAAILVDRLQVDTRTLTREGDRSMAAMLRSPATLVAGGLSAAQVLDLQTKYARILDARNARNMSGDEIFKVIADAPAAVQASFLKYATSKKYIASGSAAQCRSLARRSGHAFCFYD